MGDDRHGSHTVFPSISIKHGAPCASKAAKIEGLDYRPASSQRYVLERDARLPIDAQHAHLIESVHISGTDFINSVAFFLAVRIEQDQDPRFLLHDIAALVLILADTRQ